MLEHKENDWTIESTTTDDKLLDNSLAG